MAKISACDASPNSPFAIDFYYQFAARRFSSSRINLRKLPGAWPSLKLSKEIFKTATTQELYKCVVECFCFASVILFSPGRTGISSTSFVDAKAPLWP